MKRTLLLHRGITLVLLAGVSGAWADTVTVYLKGGGKVTGALEDKGDCYVITHRFGKVRVAKNNVLRIDSERVFQEEFGKRLAQIGADDAEGHFQLGQWAAKQNRRKAAREQYEKAIAIDPNHAGARKALGYVLYQDKWRRVEELLRSKGYVKYRGKWMRKETAATLKRQEKAKAFQREFQRKVNAAAGKILSPNSSIRARGIQEMNALAARYGAPQLREIAARLASLRNVRGGRAVTTEIRFDSNGVAQIKTFQFKQRINGREVITTLQQPVGQRMSVRGTVTGPAGPAR